MTGSQCIRAIRKQSYERKMPAERFEIPGTVDIGDGLEQPDEPHPEQRGNDEVRRGSPQRTQRGIDRRGDDRS